MFKVILSKISLLWQIPLGIFSFVVYRISKNIIAKIFTRAVKKGKQQNKQWRCISKEVLKTPMMLPFIATQGPRWNPHAVITNIGPFSVVSEISVDISEVNASAKNWTFVIYSHPDYKTLKSIGANNWSKDSNNSKGLVDIDLPKGMYSLSIRYYEWKEKIAFPSVYADGELVVETRMIPGDVNNFYHNLTESDSLFYRALHYHVYPLLKVKGLLSRKTHQKLFLPVGNPDTRFIYDWIKAGENINVFLPADLLSEARLYLCLYNKSSFPTAFFSITDTQGTFKAEKDGYYLFRLCSSNEKNSDSNIQKIKIKKYSSYE